MSHIHVIKSEQVEFKVRDKLGRGAFGTCYRGKFLHFTVCLKSLNNTANTAMFKREALFLSHCSHSNLPWLFGICDSINGRKILIISYHGYGSVSISLHKLLCQCSRSSSPIVLLQAQ